MVTNTFKAINAGIIVNKGFEKAAVMQAKDILEDLKDIEVHDTLVSFKTKNWEDIHRFIYKTQIANRVLYLIDDFDYSGEDGEDELFDKTKGSIASRHDDLLNALIASGADFRVSFLVDEHTDVTYIESEIGGILIDYAKTLGKDLKVNLKNPAMNFYVYVHNSHAYIGIDLSGDLSRRDYKLFNNAVSLKGPTAFGLLMLAGYKPKDVYMNPCCYSGTLEIEAALYASQLSHRFYNKSFPFMKLYEALNDVNDAYWNKFFAKIDSERLPGSETANTSITGSDRLLSSITAAVKNAKVAGIESMINFRRIDLDWMDIKYEESSVDKIISFIPGSSKHDKNLMKDFRQIFYQAEYILKKSGKLVIMCLSKDLLVQASSEYFDIDHEAEVHSGAQTMHVLFFKRKNLKKNDTTDTIVD